MTPYDQENNILGVYANMEKAKKVLNDLYKEDISWLSENSGIDPKDFEENALYEASSYVQAGDYWSDNTIETFIVNE